MNITENWNFLVCTWHTTYFCTLIFLCLLFKRQFNNFLSYVINGRLQLQGWVCRRTIVHAHWEIWLYDCLPDETANHYVKKQILKLRLEKIWKKPYNLDLIDPDLSSKYVETVNAYLKSNYTLPLPKLTWFLRGSKLIFMVCRL